jgi:ABC-2 type transport system permease protein
LTTVAEPELAAPPAVSGRPSSVVFAQTARAAGRSAVLWGYVFGAFVASSAWSYATIYKSQAQRDRLAATFGANKASAALFGPAPGLQTVAGFTVLKVSMTLMIVGSVWGLLTSTRLLRGEEDAGRWDLLLAGQTTRRGATTRALGGLAVAGAVLWVLTSLITAVVGISSRVDIHPGAAMFLAVALASPAVMFLAVGSLTSQLAPTRRAAASFGAVVLGISYGLRMIGDAGVGLHWLTWLSPLGWVEELSPLTSSNPWPLLLIAAFALVVSLAAVRLAGARDVGASVIPDRAESAPKLGMLGSAAGLNVRLLRATALGWMAALAVTGLLFGLVAKGAGETLSGSSLREAFGKLGATGGGVVAYLGITFLMVAALIGFVAAGQVGAARGEEAEGRLDHLLVRPLARSRWLGGRLVLAVGLIVVSGCVAGLFAWLGAASQDTGVGLASLLSAGLNAAAPALFFLGLGTFLLGVWPRAAGVGVYAVLAWSLLIELVGGIGALSHWLLDTSVFHHVAAAPATPTDWAAVAEVAGIGVVGATVGLLAFRRRDLVST